MKRRTYAAVTGIIALLAAALVLPAWGQEPTPPDILPTETETPTDPPTAPDGDQGVEGRRLAGPTREATAVQISQEAYPDGSDVVYLARRDVSQGPDALAAATLQGGPEALQGPVLFVASCGYPSTGEFLTDATEQELERLGAAEVVALGGERAICDDALEAAVAASARGRDDGTPLPSPTPTPTSTGTPTPTPTATPTATPTT